MKIIRQIVLSALVLAAGLYVWITYVPAAQPLLARLGVLDLLGIEVAEAAPAQTGPQRGGGGPASVIALPVAEADLAERINAIGDGRALRSVTVRSNAVGVITYHGLSAGGYVQSGDVLIRLQDEQEQIALEQAKITLEDARAEAERIELLEASGATTSVRLRESRLALRSAELAVRQTEFELSQREIRAPISGAVGITELEEGDRVNAQDVVVTITDRSEILIDFRVPERLVGRIGIGQSFEVTPLGSPDQILNGEISAIDAVVDRASRTLLVQGRVANEDDLLRAGMAFSVNMSFPGETVLSIPPLAVQWSGEGPFVWVVREDKVQRVDVILAQRNADSVLVQAEGLAAGDLVVTEGVQTLRPGADVTVVPQAEGDVSARQQATEGARL
jgi:RND family efflux transporter MFP subunit